MRSFAFFLTLVAIATAAILPTPSPTTAPTPSPATECSRYQLFTDVDLQNPASIPGYVPNVLVYDTVNLMTGTPEGPYFTVRSDDCFWVPTGALSCSMDLYLDSARTINIGWGTMNSTDLTVQGISTVVGFHFVSGNVQLTTTITNTAFTAPTPDVNFLPLSTSLYFPAVVMLPLNTSAAPVADGVSYVGTNEYLTLWGSNGGWNGTTWGASRTTGLDLRASIICNPSSGHGSSPPCPSCTAGAVTVPSACITSGATISQTVSGDCLSLSFASSTSTTAYNGCSGGSF